MTSPAAPAIESTATPANLGQVRGVVAAARQRLRVQGAFEGATTASILASASALGTVFAVRVEVIAPATGIGLLAASAGVIAAGAVIGATRHIDDELVARLIDRASGLADRLSTAIAFDRSLATPAGGDHHHDPETLEMMRAAMRDAARVAPRANVKAAVPFKRPHDLPAALGFAAVALIAAGIAVPMPPRNPVLLEAIPAMARRGAEVTITGERLCGAKAAATEPCSLEGALVYVGRGDDVPRGSPPATLGTSAAMLAAAAASGPVAASVVNWTGGGITLVIPSGAPIGKTELVVWARGKKWGAVPFEVLRDDDPRGFKTDTIVLDPDDEAYMRELVQDLRATGQKDQVKELEDYAAKIEQLLDMAENGQLTKEQLLQEMKKAEDALSENAEPDPEQINKDLAETGEELAKNDLTKELGKALAQNDLDKAKEELEKLAEKLEKGELTEKQQQELAKAMEKAAEQYQKKQEERDQQDQQAIEKMEEQVRKLEKEKKDARTDDERQDAERRLEKKQRELAELKKKQEEQEQSAQSRSLKRLHKDMDKAAKQLQNKDPKDGQEDGEEKPQDGQKPGQQQDGQQDGPKDGQKQASRTLKDMADETGKVDSDQRKQAAQKKVSSQMEDLREAMRRAKQRGSRGPQNPFGKNGKQGKNRSFSQRAGGKQGQGKGQGKENGGDGKEPGGPSDIYGDGHDPNLVGDATGKSGNTTDESVSGVHGKKGPSRRESILSAAQKGFASTQYKNVYTDYKKVVEDVMRTEKVPASYRRYVGKYFTKIKPHAMD